MGKSDSFPDFLDLPPDIVARRLLGCMLISESPHGTIKLKIVETEAYGPQDAASHSFRGVTKRTEAMFGPSGRLYVYFTYGMHHCMNIVTGCPGEGAAVLIRAVEVIEDGAGLVSRRRAGRTAGDRTNGPAKVCQALDITLKENGLDLSQGSLKLVEGYALREPDIVTTTRIGIRKAADVKWRFYIRDHPDVSRR